MDGAGGWRRGNLVARYVHKLNKVVQPTALDTSTGVFTCAGGLNDLFGANGTLVQSVIGRSNAVATNNVIHRELIESVIYRLKVLSDTTFLIQNQSTSVDITSYPHANNATADVSKYWFEHNPSPNQVDIDISAFNLRQFRIIGRGARGRSGQSLINPMGTWSGGNYGGPNLFLVSLDGKQWMSQIQELVFSYDEETGLLNAQGVRQSNTYFLSSTGAWSIAGAQEMSNRIFAYLPGLKFDRVRVNFDMANGYTVDVFDMGGE